MENSELIDQKYAEAVKHIQNISFLKLGTEWYDIITRLSNDLQITYMVSIFHQQVFNGGLNQYFVNGYGQFGYETIDALKTIKAFKTADLLQAALHIVDPENNPGEVFRRKILNKEIKILFEDEADDLLDKLDRIYYSDESEPVDELLGPYLKEVADQIK